MVFSCCGQTYDGSWFTDGRHAITDQLLEENQSQQVGDGERDLLPRVRMKPETNEHQRRQENSRNDYICKKEAIFSLEGQGIPDVVVGVGAAKVLEAGVLRFEVCHRPDAIADVPRL